MEQPVDGEDVREDNFDDDEEPMTAQKVLESLQSTWLNERFAPEILPQQTDLLEMMLNQIVHMDDNIKQLGKNDFRFIAHKMELERIKYIISSYLRCRLKKIEKFAVEILQEEESRREKRLSHEEHEFAVAYIANTRNHFHHIALKHMPLNLQEPTARETVRPNIAEHVFLKANVSVPCVVIGKNDEEVDLVSGSRHIMPYNLATELILDGRVQLM